MSQLTAESDAIQRLLAEIGLDPERVVLLHVSPSDDPRGTEQLVRGAVQRIGSVGESPFHAAR